jgi:hypothetical protein
LEKEMKVIARLTAACGLIAAMVVPADAAQAHNSRYDFQCQIPSIGNGNCTGDRASVGPGHYVRVKNVSSGGKKVIFKLYRISNNRLLGTSVPASPGQKVFVWRNDTRSAVRVEFRADSPPLVRVTCNARAFITHN